jgi:ABC-type multidrug transport system permease subunit
VLIIETNFTRNYLTGRAPVSLELIKNPAESISPAVLEELLGAAVAGLNVISRNFNSEFPAWERVVEGKKDYHEIATLIDRAGDKLKVAKQFIDPPLVSYQKEEPTNDVAAAEDGTGPGGTEKGAAKGADGLAALFSYLLVGMSAMFLLFLGQNGMTDLHRELRLRTFERYQTVHPELWPFIASKILFTVVMLLICSAIMLIGGGLAFGIHWRNPCAMVTLVAAYSCFVAALFAVAVALVPDERRAAALNNILGMALGIVGGCAFPPRQFPDFLREHVTPHMPTYWLVDTARSLQGGVGQVPWAWAGLKLLACAGVLVLLTGVLFRRKFKLGQR